MFLWRMLQGILKKPQKADLVMFNAIGNHSPYAFQMISSILGTECIKTTVEGLRQANSSDDDSVFCVQSFLKSQTKHDSWSPVSTLEDVFTGAIWVFGCCFFLPRRFTQMTLPLKVRAALKRIFNHNHPVSNWKERIHYGGPLKSWLNSPYLRFGGKDCCIAQQFWCICLPFAISSISLENCCKLFRYRAFCNAVESNWKHIFGGPSNEFGPLSGGKVQPLPCVCHVRGHLPIRSGQVWRKLLVSGVKVCGCCCLCWRIEWEVMQNQVQIVCMYRW